MFAKIDSERSWSGKQKCTILIQASFDFPHLSVRLLHLSVRINMEPTIKVVLQSGAVFPACINTRFQITGHLDFDSSSYEQTIVRLDKAKEQRDRITCPRQFRIFVNERCNLE